MSAALGNDDFYQNLLQYMNQNTQSSFLDSASLSLSPNEAEKRGLDEMQMDQADTKRRESSKSQATDSVSNDMDLKPKKKPGRKLMMTEPASKRKAQNRAAQRAFRDRKEAHVKGLENRVTELEELTKTKDAENQMLRDQLKSLQAELTAVRGGNFNFDFTMENVQNLNTLPNNNTVRNPFQPSGRLVGQNNAQQPSPSSSSGNVTDSSLFRSGQTSLATSPENDINTNATPKIDIPFDLFTNGSAGPLTFSSNSNPSSPLFSADLFGIPSATPNTNTPPIFGQNQTQDTSPILDTFASTLASLRQGQSPQNVTNAFNTVLSSSPSSAFTPNSAGNLIDLNDPLFSAWRENSMSSAGDENNFDIFDTMFPSLYPGALNLVDSTGLMDFIADNPITIPPQSQQQSPSATTADQSVTCPQFLEHVQTLAQLDDIDIEGLCAEMRKAKCSNSGPLLPTRDVIEANS